jgi:hypothetical protein
MVRASAAFSVTILCGVLLVSSGANAVNPGALKNATADCRAQVKDYAKYNATSWYGRRKMVKQCVKGLPGEKTEKSPGKESSVMHAIRKLRESGHATVADYEKLLAPNVVFHSPVLIRTMEGRAVVAKIFATSTTLREGAYTGEWKLDDRRTLLRWKGEIRGHELESFDIIEENDEGLIVDRTIAFRPMPAAKLFRDAMRAAMGSSIPDDFWEYSN